METSHFPPWSLKAVCRKTPRLVRGGSVPFIRWASRAARALRRAWFEWHHAATRFDPPPSREHSSHTVYCRRCRRSCRCSLATRVGQVWRASCYGRFRAHRRNALGHCAAGSCLRGGIQSLSRGTGANDRYSASQTHWCLVGCSGRYHRASRRSGSVGPRVMRRMPRPHGPPPRWLPELACEPQPQDPDIVSGCDFVSHLVVADFHR